MNLPDLKALEKLAKICRKAGIKTFKSGDVEFTLTDHEPKPATRQSKKKQEAAAAQQETAAEAPVGDVLTDPDGWEKLSFEDKVFYSSTGQLDEKSN